MSSSRHDTVESLTIGEVLSLLQEEFPDISISKIRFLESQGLIEPERTPSGYRKFYPHDIERLRWILRQQRDNFLPLRVIRDKLEGPADADPEDAADLTGAGDAAGVGAAAGSGERGADTAAAPGSAAVPGAGQADAGRPGASGRAAAGPATGATAAGEPSAARGVSAESGQGDAGRGVLPGDAAPADHTSFLRNGPPAVSMTRDELAEAAGLEVRAIVELERFGLVAPRTIGPAQYYDGEALAVARLAAAMRSFGVDARHLRMYKTAADREAGVYEQVVLPLVRQRNPAARQRARATLDDLASLAEALHHSLLRQALRGHLES